MYRLKLGLVFFMVMVVAGCAARGHSMYYWGDYSTTLYRAKKAPSAASLLAHQQTLERIIEESKKMTLAVPPGVYAELGYMYLRQNNNQRAIQCFRTEKELYPEAALFMQRMENAALAKDKKHDDNPLTVAQPEHKEENQKND